MGQGRLQRRAVGLIVLGMGFIAMGFVGREEFALTVGALCMAAGGAWLVYLT